MKLGKKEINMLLILLGLVILVVVYYTLYTPYVEKTDALNAETEVLRQRLTVLEEHYQKIPTYEAGIKTWRDEVTAIYEKYPNDVRTEDLIMYAVRMEDELGVSVNSAAFAPKSLLAAFTGIDENGAFLPLSAWMTSMTIEGETTYQQLKDSLDMIYETPELTKVENVTVSYNAETASLLGSLTLTKYFITGLDNAYHETEVPFLPIGISNPFRTNVAE